MGKCGHPACDNMATKVFDFHGETRNYCGYHYDRARQAVVEALAGIAPKARKSAYSFGDKITCKGRAAIYIGGGPDDFWVAVFYRNHHPGENPESVGYAKYASIKPGWEIKE